MNYDDFLRCWQEADKKWSSYQNDVAHIVTECHTYFCNKLVHHVKKRENYLSMFLPGERNIDKILKESYKPSAEYIEFGDDGWHNIGFILLFKSDKIMHIKSYFCFTIAVKRKSIDDLNTWIIKIREGGEEHLISIAPKQNELEEIWKDFEKIFTYSVSQISNGNNLN